MAAHAAGRVVIMSMQSPMAGLLRSCRVKHALWLCYVHAESSNPVLLGRSSHAHSDDRAASVIKVRPCADMPMFVELTWGIR